MDVEDVMVPVGRKLNKIERAGPQVMAHAMELVRTSDLTYTAIARRLNENYSHLLPTKLKVQDVTNFFQKNAQFAMQVLDDMRDLNNYRAKIHLDHARVLSKDIQAVDKQILKLMEDDLHLEPDVQSRTLAQLWDLKRKMLESNARMNGNFNDKKSGTNIEKMQVNVFNKIEQEKSDIKQRLKQADFNIVKPKEKQTTETIIEAEVTSEDNKTNS